MEQPKHESALMASVGRPTDYRPEFAEQAAKLCALGATDQEIADFFEVARSTFYLWKATHKEFSDAIKTAKEVADDRVERSLYQRASGYEQDAVKIFMPAGATAPVYADYRERIPPDPTSMIFWLKNRRPDVWRDRQIQELTGPNGTPLTPAINITVDAAGSLEYQPAQEAGGSIPNKSD